MNKFIRIFLSLFFVMAITNKGLANSLSDMIKNSPLDKSSVVAVSVKNVENGKVVYEYNQHKLLHPASTLKVFSLFPALDVLGDEYKFTTAFYVYNNDLYVKVGADPLLVSENIKDCVKAIKSLGYKSFKNVYFDDSVMDNVEWGVGWMWDDGTNNSMPKFSAYNLDSNLVKITVSKNANGTPVIETSSQIPLLNAVKAGKGNNVYAVRHDWTSPDIICVTGTVATEANVLVPINNMRRYYETRLFNYLNRSNIKIENKTVLNGRVPENAIEVARTGHFANALVGNILKLSDNRCAETIAKIAGGEKAQDTATLANQLKVFYDYWNAQGIDTTEISVADASGVSRNNLVTVDFMTNALNKLYETQGAEKMKSYLAQPGEGTLSNRMLNHRGNLYLKTGTLANISGITGYVVTEKGKTYSVAILIQNFLYPSAQVKLFEDELLEEIEKL